jgi:hypothetical protein
VDASTKSKSRTRVNKTPGDSAVRIFMEVNPGA